MGNHRKRTIVIQFTRIELPYDADPQLIHSLMFSESPPSNIEITQGEITNEEIKTIIDQKQLMGNSTIHALRGEVVEYLKVMGMNPNSFKNLIDNISDSVEELNEDIERQRQIKNTRRRTLHELELQQAKFAGNAQPNINTEIEDMQKLIEDSNLRLDILYHCKAKLESYSS